MTRSDDQPRDDRLADLLSDAVSDVEPANRLDAIRDRTKVIGLRSRRPWLYAVGGAVVATAAVITAIALVGGGSPGPSADDAPPAGRSDHVTDGSTEPTPSETSSPSSSVVAVYFTGDTPAGPRLFREFLENADDLDPVAFAVDKTLAGAARDPDYGTLWPNEVSVTVTGYDADLITVRLSGVPAERPAGLSADDAGLALQQVVYSAQAALGQGRLPVLIESDGSPETVLGESVSEPLQAAPEDQVRAMVNISDPAEGATVSGTFVASGVANSFEATVPWEIRQGDQVVEEGFATADSWMDKLYPWQSEVDVSGLEPGEYTFVAMTDDPSGGEEGFGPTIDNRTIVVE